MNAVSNIELANRLEQIARSIRENRTPIMRSYWTASVEDPKTFFNNAVEPWFDEEDELSPEEIEKARQEVLESLTGLQGMVIFYLEEKPKKRRK
ncbi:hypothetical protein [Deinococcus actinosclerus]|uniref:hypothetical protein n=1 Tax=Deinococcus actinosclerus TaxID=1768108 RepID=UPI0012FCC946|nr:hypothetical protein [Deinococcus actinosclerus]